MYYVDGYLGNYWFRVMENKASMNIHVQIFMWTCVSGSNTKHKLNFIRNYQTVFQCDGTISHTHVLHEISSGSAFSAAIRIISLANLNHANRPGMVSHWALICIS